MIRKILLKDVIYVVKLSVFIIQCWPLPINTTRLRMIYMDIYHGACIILCLFFAVISIYSCKRNAGDFATFTNLLILTSAMLHCISNFICVQVNYSFLQKVTYEMIHISNSMAPYEEIVFQRYIYKCLPLYGTSVFLFYFITFLTVSIIPVLLHQPFPTVLEYPFDVFYQPLKTIIYLKQSMCGFIMAAHLCFNVYMALLIWFASIRFEILSEQLKKTVNAYQLFECIRKHQELLKYAKDVSLTVRSFAFISVCCGTVSLITIFLLLLKDHSTVILLWCSGLISSALVEVFMYTWPAENLMHTSSEVGHVAFEILDNHYFVKIWRCLQIIIMRNQKLLQINIPCLMPALSFNYFAAYLSTILSYFTTLRVMLIEDD